MKSLNFLFRTYILGNKHISKIIKIFTAIVYLLSEFEAEIQIPGNATVLRYFYMSLIKVKFGAGSYFGKKLIIYNGFNLKVGKNASIGENAMLHAHAEIVIGNDFLAAPGLTINSGGHNILDLQAFGKKVVIGDRVWCGVNVTILPGVTIGNDVVIGASTVINKSIPSNSVVVGVPGRIIKKIDRTNVKVWKWYDEQQKFQPGNVY